MEGGEGLEEGLLVFVEDGGEGGGEVGVEGADFVGEFVGGGGRLEGEGVREEGVQFGEGDGDVGVVGLGALGADGEGKGAGRFDAEEVGFLGVALARGGGGQGGGEEEGDGGRGFLDHEIIVEEGRGRLYIYNREEYINLANTI